MPLRAPALFHPQGTPSRGRLLTLASSLSHFREVRLAALTVLSHGDSSARPRLGQRGPWVLQLRCQGPLHHCLSGRYANGSGVSTLLLTMPLVALARDGTRQLFSV